jgi:hypothetical protein
MDIAPPRAIGEEGPLRRVDRLKAAKAPAGDAFGTV